MSLRKTGFTLVEVMVASTIGAFIMLVAVGTLRAITASSEKVDKNINSAAEIRFASRMLAKDFVNFYRDESMENMKLIGTHKESDDGNTSYLIFYTVSRAKARIGQPEGDIYEVEYYLTKNEDKSLLMRRMWPNPNKEETEPGGILAVIAEDIDIFEVRYFDGEEWSYEWPEEMGALPQLIEINLVAIPSTTGEPTTESIMVNLTRSVTATTATEESESSQQQQQGSQEIQSGGNQGNQGSSR
jgi:type II secretion system protein J